MTEILLFGSMALMHGAFFLWIARGGAKTKRKSGAQTMAGKGPMMVNAKVWDKQYWNRIENTKRTYGS
jgi:hypothetical protein